MCIRDRWLIEKNIIGLYGVDTRALVKILRSNGSMNGLITTEKNDLDSCLEIISNTPNMQGLNLAKDVSTKKNYIFKATTMTDFDVREKIHKNINKFKIVAIDFGIKKSIINRLVSHGCEILVVPSNSSFEDVLSHAPDGIFFSNGPGDPSSVLDGINLAKSLIDFGKIPMFGICLCLLYTSPSPRDRTRSRMPSSA